MALYALSDLHLSFGTDKPMDVFGTAWHDYTDRIYTNWNQTVTSDDTVIIGGDVSWATYLDETKQDFDFINSLPGQKIIIKGNHDYWWESITKLRSYTSQLGYESLHFLHNSAYIYQSFSIAGTRGWLLPGADGFGSDDKKIYDRELIRLALSLDEAVKLEKLRGGETYQKVAVMHYPPVTADGTPDDGIMSVLKKYDVKKCIYGHLHGTGLKQAFTGNINGIDFILTSADYLQFKPVEII